MRNESGARLNSLNDSVQVGEVEARADTLGIEIQSQGDQVNVSSSLSIAKNDTLASRNSLASLPSIELR